MTKKLKKYTVTRRYVCEEVFEVEAANRKDAVQEAIGSLQDVATRIVSNKWTAKEKP